MNQYEIYVGNFPYDTSKEDIREFFTQYGEVNEVKLIMDFDTGQSKGFGFVSFSSEQECQNALKADGVEFGNRKLRVNPAKSKSGGGGRPGGNRSGGRHHHRRD